MRRRWRPAATTTVTVPELVRGPLGPFLTHREQDVRAQVLLLALLLERRTRGRPKGTTGRGGNDDNDTPPCCSRRAWRRPCDLLLRAAARLQVGALARALRALLGRYPDVVLSMPLYEEGWRSSSCS